MSLWCVLTCACAATKPKPKANADDLPLIDANKMKKIEVIHVAPRDTDKPEVETGLEAELDEAEDADEPEPNVAKLADADGDPEETSGEPPASKKTSEGDVADEGSEQLPEPGSASGTASRSSTPSRSLSQATTRSVAASSPSLTMPEKVIFWSL